MGITEVLILFVDFFLLFYSNLVKNRTEYMVSVQVPRK